MKRDLVATPFLLDEVGTFQLTRNFLLFLGKVRRWNDPRSRRANPDVKRPEPPHQHRRARR
jgi:hypothetical protein